MTVRTDIFNGAALCSHPSCQWETPDGWSGIEARYEDKDGNPSCFSHRAEDEGTEE